MVSSASPEKALDSRSKVCDSGPWSPASTTVGPEIETLIVFDYDDTLLCTSFLQLFYQEQPLPASVEQQLRRLEVAACSLLELALRWGHVLIISNAVDGWVEYSAMQWLPGLVPFLKRVRVISAQSKYADLYPGQNSQWKAKAFMDLQEELDLGSVMNIVSMGDSWFERDAACALGNKFTQAFTKTIKFKEKPSPEELRKELELLALKFEKIMDADRNLTINLERKWSGKTP